MALIHLCTLQDLKNRIEQPETVITDNVAITQIIPGVSAEIEKFIGRFIHRTDYTEVFDIHTSNDLIHVLSGYPNVSITDVRCAHDRIFDTASIMDTDTYEVDPDTGIVEFELGYLYTGFRVLQVNYNGGIATDTDDLESSNEGLILREAAVIQCAHRVNTRKEIGATSMGGGELGNVSWITGHGLLPEVQDRLRPLRKVT